MQYVDDVVGKRWRSGCVGKLYVTGMGILLSICLCSGLAALVPSRAPATRTQPIIAITPTVADTAEPTATATAEPATDTPAPTDTPIPTDTPVPTQPPTAPPPTNTPRPVAPVVVPPVVPPVRSGGAVNPFTCAGGCPEPPDPSCNIKGNISISSGERIYHVPGQVNYDDTKISPEYGERWFCTEEEAVQAGWRKAKR